MSIDLFPMEVNPIFSTYHLPKPIKDLSIDNIVGWDGIGDSEFFIGGCERSNLLLVFDRESKGDGCRYVYLINKATDSNPHYTVYACAKYTGCDYCGVLKLRDLGYNFEVETLPKKYITKESYNLEPLISKSLENDEDIDAMERQYISPLNLFPEFEKFIVTECHSFWAIDNLVAPFQVFNEHVKVYPLVHVIDCEGNCKSYSSYYLIDKLLGEGGTLEDYLVFNHLNAKELSNNIFDLRDEHDIPLYYPVCNSGDAEVLLLFTEEA